MPIWIKICGITNASDAAAAAEAGASALGFMFYEGSKRNVAPAAATGIIHELPAFISKVGVFVNAQADVVRRVIAETGIDGLQFHGEETPEFCAQFGLKVIKAFPVRDRESLRACAAYPDCAWLLDTFVDGARGGTGVAFDRDVATEAVKLSRRVILAGGLKPETVAEAVRQVRPFGVDVSSGVEFSPGRKDHTKVRAFISAAKAA